MKVAQKTKTRTTIWLRNSILRCIPEKNKALVHSSSVQFNHSVVSDSLWSQTVTLEASMCITNSQSALKLMFIKSAMPSNHFVFYCLLLQLPSIFPSIRVFSNESVLPIRWPKYWSFNFSINPSNEYSGPISFRMDWVDLLAVQGTLKSLLQYLTVQRNQFFGNQLSLWSNSHIHTWLWKNHSFV